MHFFTSCQIDVVNKQLFSPLSWTNLFIKNKVSQFNTSQKNLIKTIERVKKQTMFQRKMADFKIIKCEKYKDWKCMIYKIVFIWAPV